MKKKDFKMVIDADGGRFAMEEQQYDVSMFTTKLHASDWDEVESKYQAKLKAAKEIKAVWRVQEVENEAEMVDVGRERLWKVVQVSDGNGSIDEKFVPGTERIWTRCLHEVQAKKIKDVCEAKELDPVAAMISIWFGKTRSNEPESGLLPSLEHQISKLAGILIEDQCNKLKCAPDYHKCKYADLDQNVRFCKGKTIMHLVAEENMSILASQLITKFPGLLLLGQDSDDKLPVQLALAKFNDEVAAVMIKRMNNERVRDLFISNRSDEKPSQWFKDLIQHKGMKKSVITVLDCLIKPEWPFVDEDENDNSKGAWSKIADVPVRYHVYYRLLDGDPSGRSPFQLKNDSKVPNRHFDLSSESNFKALIGSPNQEILIRHPAVRMLADQKWDLYGKRWVRYFAVNYAFYLASLSIALICAASVKDPLSYHNGIDYFRLVLETISLSINTVYLVLEIDQVCREKLNYLADPYNYLDFPGILLLFGIVPLRFYSVSGQWEVSAIAFFINFLRIFKFASAWPDVGLYAKCMVKMVFKDGLKFAVVYLPVILAFSGSIFLALRGANNLKAVGGFDDMILREITILVNGQPFTENYSSFNVFIVILIMVNMIIVSIMLLNMLIAHLSNSYGDYQKDADIRFSIDKAWMVSKLDHSIMKYFTRLRHFKEGAYEGDMEKVRRIMNDWNSLKAEKNIENLPNEAEKKVVRNLASQDRFYGVIL